MQLNCAHKFFHPPFVFQQSQKGHSPRCAGSYYGGCAAAKKPSMASCLPHRHSTESKQKVERFVDAMQSKGIKLLALDFDLTFIDIHTHGEWRSTVDDLLEHVRPCMRDLLQTAHKEGLYVCIVTFHPWPWLIRELLNKLYPKKLTKHIRLQAVSHTHARQFSSGNGFVGKEFHIQKVVDEIAKEEQVPIHKREILLLDDDLANVNHAIANGHRAFQLLVEDKVVDYETLDSFERMLRIAG